MSKAQIAPKSPVNKDSDVILNNVTESIADDFAHTRLGVLYFFSSMKVESNVFGNIMGTITSMTATTVKGATKDPIKALEGWDKKAATYGQMAGAKVLSKGGEFGAGKLNDWFNDDGVKTPKAPAVKDPKAPLDKLVSFREKINEYLKAFVAKVVDMLRKKFGEFDFSGVITTAITAIVKAISAEASLFVGDIIAGAKGAAVAIDGFAGRIKSWMLEKEVHLAEGYPKAVVQGVNRAMVMSALDGVSQLAKSSIAIGVAAGAAAASPIVNAVMNGAEALFRFIWRLFEKARIDKFLVEAAAHWKNRDGADALHKSPMGFAAWYRSHAIATPILAAMTLNSGICGSKMHYLQLFTSSGAVVSQGEFDKGVKLLDGLKPRCGEFIRSCPHKFTSTDPFVIKLMANHLTDPADLRNGIWAIVRGQKKLSFNTLKKIFA